MGPRTLYHDTDSVMLTVKKDDYLGDLTDELESYGRRSYIDEYVSGGPKNFGLEVYCFAYCWLNNNKAIL
jgi:hypothetical protein